MTQNIEKRLQELNIVLPTPAASVAAYVPYVVHAGLVYVAGQLPMVQGAIHDKDKGRVGVDVSLEQAKQAARLCGLNILAQVKSACEGDLSRVIRCVKLGGFVACGADFSDHSKVINGASELMVDIFGDVGRHARFAVGVSSLPLGACVEVDALFAVR